ncbi:hypothetical protein EV356DRAFT_536284 [Viridothelium virens]|uniref:Uncharacterized protein n=1 Tax=Viridothelium virens TaxID=1048519 RepID=A0A6A6GYL4_VIRVR|nr:hypothetical protein EV356DRAFT_536284 [Viridothelium virens]
MISPSSSPSAVRRSLQRAEERVQVHGRIVRLRLNKESQECGARRYRENKYTAQGPVVPRTGSVARDEDEQQARGTNKPDWMSADGRNATPWMKGRGRARGRGGTAGGKWTAAPAPATATAPDSKAGQSCVARREGGSFEGGGCVAGESEGLQTQTINHASRPPGPWISSKGQLDHAASLPPPPTPAAGGWSAWIMADRYGSPVQLTRPAASRTGTSLRASRSTQPTRETLPSP